MAGVVFQNRYNNSIKYLDKKINEGVFGKRVLNSERVRWCRELKVIMIIAGMAHGKMMVELLPNKPFII